MDKLKQGFTPFFPELVSSNLKKWFEDNVKAAVIPLGKVGVTPNMLTVLGIIFAVVTAYGYTLAPANNMYLIYSGALIIVSGLLDAIDGVLARSTGKVTRFGGFFDSVSDRYSDAIIYTGIIVAGLCDLTTGLVALFGSMLVSYARARAEMEGVKMAGIGLAERAERMTFLSFCSIAAYWWAPALNYGVLILAILAQFTVLQRIIYFKKEIERN
ncbi:CDP-alcohol phosphatidyltransferase family protein [Candidatus Bathyarchaeota archaeon]|nr:MAG: CDP-alcohol phosphatidyltransferase family protein [Candidatus Bathyarchaeota archaeon]